MEHFYDSRCAAVEQIVDVPENPLLSSEMASYPLFHISLRRANVSVQALFEGECAQSAHAKRRVIVQLYD
jgi:hypothetical protein